MKKGLVGKKLVALVVILIFIANNIHFGAVITGNDGSAYVPKAEFAALKQDLETKLTTITADLSHAISDVIPTTLVLVGGDGDEIEEKLKKIYPIGSIVVANTAPGFGTWEEIWDPAGACLWLDETRDFGAHIQQRMPLPKFNIKDAEDEFEKENVQEWCDSTKLTATHTHNIEGVLYYKAKNTVFGKQDASSGYNYLINVELKLGEHNPHFHTLNKTFTSNTVASHTHTITAKDDNPYKGAPGSKVQPNAYVVKMWKRTA